MVVAPVTRDTKRWSRAPDKGFDFIRQDGMLGQVADAINEAPAGHIISGSEEKVRDVFAEFRQRAYEKGLQMRVNAAEAAFPPSGGREDG